METTESSTRTPSVSDWITAKEAEYDDELGKLIVQDEHFYRMLTALFLLMSVVCFIGFVLILATRQGLLGALSLYLMSGMFAFVYAQLSIVSTSYTVMSGAINLLTQEMAGITNFWEQNHRSDVTKDIDYVEPEPPFDAKGVNHAT